MSLATQATTKDSPSTLTPSVSPIQDSDIIGRGISFYKDEPELSDSSVVPRIPNLITLESPFKTPPPMDNTPMAPKREQEEAKTPTANLPMAPKRDPIPSVYPYLPDPAMPLKHTFLMLKSADSTPMSPVRQKSPSFDDDFESGTISGVE
jgi:hypothetical protein